MSVEVGVGSETPTRSPAPSLPSDFSDVQSRSYDPDFISDISNKMQVPHRIAMGDEEEMLNGGLYYDSNIHRPMNVPDRIILTGANEHVATRPHLQQFRFDTAPSQPDPSYVNLLTPPRTLTFGEGNFPTVEDHVNELEEHRGLHVYQQQQQPHMNGSAVPVPFTPGISPNDSLLLNEEDEGTLLRTQLSKLTRRLTVMEQENQKRSQREILLYPMVFGYFLFKVFGWFFRSGR